MKCLLSIIIPALLVIIISWLVTCTANGQVQTIWIPAGGGGSSYNQITIDKPITVTANDGVNHILQKSTISGINYHIASEDMGFSGEESKTVLAFIVNLDYSPSRKDLEANKKQHYWLFVPISEIERIVVPGQESFGHYTEVHVSLKKKDVSLPVLAIDFELCDFNVKGEEDMGEFGHAKFDQLMGRQNSIKEIIFTPLAEIKIAPKSSRNVIVTEVSGKKHELSDVRIANNAFTFWRGDAKLELNPDKVQKIEVLRMANMDKEYEGFICSITLKSGAQQELVWKKPNIGIGGKDVDNLYELIPIKAIKTVEFVDSTKAK